MDFIHLHNHSDYSILDGAITVDKLVKKAVEFGMPAIALTDHGNMFGAVEFYLKAKKAGIKPIIGEEFYVAPGSRFKKEFSKDSGEEKAYHLVILAKNLTGYNNLLKLSSIGYLEGFYYKPRIDMEVLEKYSEGLICSSACLAGEIPVNILKGNYEKARDIAGKFNEIFGKDHFYLELQDHGIPEQKKVNEGIIKISKELNIPLIATNDAHYVNRDDAYSHEVLLCIQTNKTMDDPKRMKFYSDEFYLKSKDEMLALFPDYPDAIYNTGKINDMIDLELDLGNPILPNFDVPEGHNLDTYLRHLVDEGAAKLYGENPGKEVQDRIDYELSVITGMKFPGYFLIVWDFINYARSIGVPVGPGRGSAAGSIVSYCLGITSLDPLKYDLLFERFLNPDRNEMPDMDLDFCANRREEIIDYVKQKYGEDHVSQIITFNTMKAKAVVKDVARALDIPFQRANEISKLIEGGNLKEALDNSKELQDLHKDGDMGTRLIDISLKLEGLARSAGKHAAGVVISKGPLTDYVPLYKDPREGSISSQYEKNTLEQAGLVKMDFLGLKNLTIIDKCLKLIKQSTGDVVDIEKIPLDDAKTYSLLQNADTKGVFQLESGGMQNILRRLGPTVFEDIIAIVALYRPGPLGSGMVEEFIKRKRNPELVAYPHELLEPILGDTLGVVVYQEQVMLISRVIAGFTLPEADKLRKAMGKKKMDIIDALEEKFLAGAEKNGIDVKLAEDLYSMIKKFGEYGFNKSHSAAYALVTYQTAYLKAHYPVQYMTALLSAQPDSTDDVIQYINDCRSAGIKVLPPSINRSEFDFTIEDNQIRFGLGAVKGAGGKAIENIVKIREKVGEFRDLRDFLENVGTSSVNRGVIEAFIKAGAFDTLEPNRARLLESIDLIIDTARKLQEDRASGQGNLFMQGDPAEQSRSLDLPDVEEWHDNIKLSFEKEVLGLYISGHPLAKYSDELRYFTSVSISQLTGRFNGREVAIVGIINNFQTRRSQKTGNLFATGILEDLNGTIELIVFSKTLEKYGELLASEEPVMVSGKLETEEDIPKKILVSDVKTLKQFRRESVTAIHIQLEHTVINDTVLASLREVFQRHHGECPVYIHVKRDEAERIVKVHNSYYIAPSETLMKDLSGYVDSDSLRYSIGYH